jgi:hypothetical protein
MTLNIAKPIFLILSSLKEEIFVELRQITINITIKIMIPRNSLQILHGSDREKN